MLEINKIYNMNCLDGMGFLDDCSVDLIVTSPPYGVAKEYETSDPKRQLSDLVNLLERSFVEFYRVVKNGGYVFINFGDNAFGKKINKTEVLSTIPMAIYYYDIGIRNGFELQATRIWRKSFGAIRVPFCLNVHPRPVFDYEHLWTFRKPDGIGKEKVNSHKISRRGIWATTPSDEAYDGKYESKVLKSHPAAFPLLIPKNAITLYSDEGDLVLDPFIGFGTTALACTKLNRNYIGFEINPDYFELAEDRLSKAGRK